MGIHFWRIRKDGGLSRPLKYAEDKGNANKWHAWPALMWTELGLLLLVLIVVLFAALLFNAPLLEQANPAFPENPAKSPWYFLGIQELVSYSAFAGGLLIPLLYLVFLFSIPYRDREDRHIGLWFSGKSGLAIVWRSAVFAVFLVVLQLAVMIRWGWLRDWIPGISQWFVLLINPATLTGGSFILLAEWIRRRRKSTRMAALALFTCTFVALVIFTAMGIWFRGPNWEFYWSLKHWPAL
jgi:hypothetical protein